MGFPPVFPLFSSVSVGLLADKGAGGRLGATLQLTAMSTFLLWLVVKISPETLRGKAQPGKLQAERFFSDVSGAEHTQGTFLGVGNVCSGRFPKATQAPSCDQGRRLHRQLGKGSPASTLPEQPDLRSREAQVDAWGLWPTLIRAAACYHHPQRPHLPDFPPFQPAGFRCLWPGVISGPLSKLWGQKS